MSPRTLRAANAALYSAIALLVLGVAVYVGCTREDLLQQALAVVGGLVTLLWAAHYLALRYTVDAAGIYERRLFRKTRCLLWAEVVRVELRHQHMQEVESITLLLHGAERAPMRLSSELISLEAMEALVGELRRAGILKA